jgi:hypothetical protein
MTEMITLFSAIQTAFDAAVDAAIERRMGAMHQSFRETIDELSNKIAILEAAQEPEGDVAESLTDEQLRRIAGYISPSDLVENIDFSMVLDYSEIAGEIDLGDLASELDVSDLANEVDPQRIAESVDMESAIRDFFRENRLTVSF